MMSWRGYNLILHSCCLSVRIDVAALHRVVAPTL